MMYTILERVLLSFGVVATFGAATWTIVAVGRWWTRLQFRRRTPEAVSESGDVTLLYFWSAGCAQCRPQEEQIEQARRTLERSGRSIAIRKHDALAERGISKAMHVMTVPTTVLVDPRGNVVAWNPGFTPWKKLLDQLESVGNDSPPRRTGQAP